MGYTMFQRMLVLALAISLQLSGQSISKDRRTAVNRGEWSAQTVSLFNTWGGLDSNPGRVLTLPSPDGKKNIQVKNETVGIVIEGKGYRTRLGKKRARNWAGPLIRRPSF